VDEKTAQTNRLTSHLKIYFPQMLGWFDRLDTELVCALLERWPTLEELQKVPPARLRTFFRKHRCRDQELIERRMVGIQQAIPATRDRAAIEATSAVVKISAQLIRSLARVASRIWTEGLRRRRRRWRHACWPRLARSGSATPTQKKCRPTRGSRQ